MNCYSFTSKVYLLCKVKMTYLFDFGFQVRHEIRIYWNKNKTNCTRELLKYSVLFIYAWCWPYWNCKLIISCGAGTSDTNKVYHFYKLWAHYLNNCCYLWRRHLICSHVRTWKPFPILKIHIIPDISHLVLLADE